MADYAFVSSPARIAIYDDLRSAPRVLTVDPAPTAEFIESLASTVYEQAQRQGGSVPYTVVREVSENFIHASFCEVVVSILDGGDTIRFADQGPGIPMKEKAQLPGFSSAVEPMKRFIRGVGSGLPIVREYLGVSKGSLSIEDNLHTGAVVTISMADEAEPASPRERSAWPEVPATHQAFEEAHIQMIIAPLAPRERLFLTTLAALGVARNKDLADATGTAPSSAHVTCTRLEEAGLLETIAGKKRQLTPLGRSCAQALAQG